MEKEKNKKKGYWTGKKRPGMRDVLGWNRTGKVPWNKGKKFPEKSGKNHPNWNGGLKDHICEFCTNPFITKRSNKQRFCSPICKNDYIRVNKVNSGKNSATWKGGKTINRNTRYFKKVISPKLRKKYNCWVCDTNKDLVVHHLDLSKKNDDLKNLTVMCRSHHISFHNIVNKMSINK